MQHVGGKLNEPAAPSTQAWQSLTMANPAAWYLGASHAPGDASERAVCVTFIKRTDIHILVTAAA